MAHPPPPQPRTPEPAEPATPAEAPLDDDDSTSVAGEEDPGASLDPDALKPSAGAAAPAGTSRARRPRRG